ncbi:16S rRNA (guanine(966)-N(2))-methyltransferase RsmD [Ornithinibacillus californiensis]|uniref:16S rRNA (guanine(966)-N(2))-methyltransferase RsmD n=1 Tax=Ornithinibacillus californiensis TaxID=161536 RepID=UPI00064DC61E|nr:16S rRNA (guanine(966)-N(2))-methyltransferase RsmD [Ornithinibacillus californiensis]
MRVIAGIHKGRQLKSVPGNDTRPTTDKVKEAVFQVLGPYFQGGHALDLFAGSGSLGIEALSRGMDKCVFVDKHPKAIQTIRENISTLKLEGQVEVFRADAYRALSAAGKRKLKFDLIFLDPPYTKISYTDLLEVIEKEQLISSAGIIYCEHDIKDTLPDSNDKFSIIKQTHYGGTIGITIYQKN